MSAQFQFNVPKCFEVLFFIIQSFGGSVSTRRLFQIVYLVEQRHLARYGLPVTGDIFIAGKETPLPFNLLSIYLGMNGRGLYRHFAAPFARMFSFSEDGTITAHQRYDDECISRSEAECLFHVIHMHKKLSPDELTEKSCDQAWMQAQGLGFLSLAEMAEAGGAGEDMLYYLSENLKDELLITDESQATPRQLIDLFDVHVGDVLERSLEVNGETHRGHFVVISAATDSYRLVRIRHYHERLGRLQALDTLESTFEKIVFPGVGTEVTCLVDCSRVESVQSNRIVSFSKCTDFPVARMDAGMLAQIKKLVLQAPTITQRTRKLL